MNRVAAPVREDCDGAIVAAVSVTALKARAGLDALTRDVLPDLPTTTETISREPGWRP
ncbi:hypothetical protein [Streptomyces sp. VRA16 Mangrove soil]|uniref:hypothetical protein n=1 Tax=Streptomyces sp. VRA16 Mangrove soil TaxID=2817434 RepID=UPI001A9DD6D7|nr:hypothetical protein [Streptomyces sp. VRA16 Mangrove soil]MBO1337149.1 hypothetical protein [Streptomyces sp. VRA16 Mangrove soil]